MRLIDADALIEQLESHIYWGDSVIGLLEVAKNAPTIDAEPVVHGRWETYPSHANRRCSVCKIEWDKPKFNIRANYCPNCGAKMEGRRGVKEDADERQNNS